MNLYCNHCIFGLMLCWMWQPFTVNSRSNWCGQYMVLGVSCPQIGMPSIFYFKINNVFNLTQPKLTTASLASPSSQTPACISLPAQSQLSSCTLKPKYLNVDGSCNQVLNLYWITLLGYGCSQVFCLGKRLVAEWIRYVIIVLTGWIVFFIPHPTLRDEPLAERAWKETCGMYL